MYNNYIIYIFIIIFEIALNSDKENEVQRKPFFKTLEQNIAELGYRKDGSEFIHCAPKHYQEENSP